MSSRKTVKERRTPYVSETRTGTVHKFDAVLGMDRVNKNGIQIQIRTKLYNLCAMIVYETKSMEELRFEDYIDDRKFPATIADRYPSSFSIPLFSGAATTQTNSIFGSNIPTTLSALNVSSVENKLVVSTAPLTPFTFGAPVTTTSAIATPFRFTSSPATYPTGLFSSFVPATASVTSSAPFTFGSRETTNTFNLALALQELKNCTRDSNKEKVPDETHVSRKPSRASSPEIARICTDCKKTPQMQCLHCSKEVCMDCAQKHVALAKEQIEVAQQTLNEKLSILDRLSTTAKERVNLEREKIIQQIDTERDQAFVQIDQLLEQQKKQIQEKTLQLTQLSLDKISSYIQRMNTEIEELNDDNDQLFCVTCTLPKIQVQYKH